VKFRLLIVALASIAVLSGCGNSSDPVRVDLDNSAPGVPSGLRVYNDEFSQTRWVEWNAVSAADLAGYQVYRYNPNPMTESSYEMVAEVATPQTRYLLPTIEPGNTVTVRVRAVNNGGKQSAYSEPITAEYVAFRNVDASDVPGGTGRDTP